MKTTFTALCLSTFLSACASLGNPLPQGYAGPTARLSDYMQNVESGKAEFFVVQEVDGTPVRNAIHKTRESSAGRGFSLIPEFYSRDIPAKPLKLKLVGTHVTAAPIHELASRSAGTFFSVEAVVTFQPQPNRRYVVAGELKKQQSRLWIEDAESKSIVLEASPVQ